MATFNKFNSFVGDLGTKLINLNGDSLMMLLTNTLPVAGDTVVDTTTTPCTVKATSNAVEIAAGNGYVKGGNAVAAAAYSQAAGVGKLTGTAVTFVASGGPIGPFRYVVLYDNSSGTTATRSVIGWWDYGAAQTLNDGESFKVAKDTAGGNWDTTTPLISIT